MPDTQKEINIPYPAAGTQGVIEISLDDNLFHHQSDQERWHHLQSVFIQEGVCSVLSKKAIHAKFSYRDQSSGEYCEPVLEIAGRETQGKWKVYIREVSPEVAEDLFNKSQFPQRKAEEQK